MGSWVIGGPGGSRGGPRGPLGGPRGPSNIQVAACQAPDYQLDMAKVERGACERFAASLYTCV